MDRNGSLVGSRSLSHGAGPLGTVSFDTVGSIYTTFGGGGEFNSGGVVKLNAASKHKLYWFNGKNGAEPTTGVLVDSKNAVLYGTTYLGGSIGMNAGTIYEITSPPQETVLYNFCSQPNCTDGAGPWAGLVKDKAGNLYGTTKLGGANGLGVVYEITR